MYNFIGAHFDSILFVMLLVLFLLLLFKRGAKKQVNEILFYLVTKAENEFGNGTGQLKYSAVTTWIYERLPTITKFLFTSKQIDKMIEDAVERMKEYLSRNTNAKSLVDNYVLFN
ncbi:MAG TPA: hypothetical protein GX707_09815 [Epulopiscium sp.]|nr:hypothetical protein [Candidatus Epulonipiscium sp.]